MTTAVKLELSTPVLTAAAIIQFEYDLLVQWTLPFTIKRSFELVSSHDGRGDLSFRSLDGVLPLGANTPQTTHQKIADFRRVEHEVHVVVVMLVETGGHARLVVSNALKFSH